MAILTDDQLGRPHGVIGPIRARVTSGYGWNKTRAIEDADSKLRETALKMGANAVINVQSIRGISMTSWKALTVIGTAVVAEPSHGTCPACAEMISVEAALCRFCGRDVA